MVLVTESRGGVKKDEKVRKRINGAHDVRREDRHETVGRKSKDTGKWEMVWDDMR